MDPLPEFNKPAYYEFRVRSRISPQSAAWFEGMEIAVDETAEPVQTLIKGYMEDQSALHGLISRIRDLGLTLVSVNHIERKEDQNQNDGASEV
ncbi:MAG TPA: hypothetical protein VIS10_16770 [Anaerolineales bacterium]